MNIKGAFGKKNAILALEINPDWLKAAISKEENGIRKITVLYAEKLTSNDDATVIKAIEEVIQKFKLINFTLVTSLPRHSVIVRYMRLPSIDSSEIENMTKLQAIKQLPYSKDELIMDYKILEKDAEGYSKVMLAAIHKNALNKQLDILKAAGLAPALVALSSEAINQYFVNITPKVGTVALIDVDFAFTEMQIHKDGKLVFSRSLHSGLKSLEDEGHTRTWLEEIKLSLNTYAREKGAAGITEIILTGAAWKKEGIEKILNDELKLPAEVVYPLKNINIMQDAKSEFERSMYLASFSSVIALALYYEQLKINLLPYPIRLEQERRAKYKSLINAGILLACLVLIFAALFFKKLHDKEVYLEILKQKFKEIAPEAEVLNKKANTTRIILQQSEAKGSCLDVIREIYAIIPSNIYLTKLIFNEGKGVTLEGSSPSMSSTFEFIAILEKSEYFNNVQLKYASKRKATGADITDFEIYSPLR